MKFESTGEILKQRQKMTHSNLLKILDEAVDSDIKIIIRKGQIMRVDEEVKHYPKDQKIDIKKRFYK